MLRTRWAAFWLAGLCAGATPAFASEEETQNVKDVALGLEDPDVYTRLDALKALGALGPKAKPVLPVILKQIKDPEPANRALAAELAGNFGPDSVAALPDLLEAMKADDPGVRKSAVQALGQLGPKADEKVKEIAALLKDENDSVAVAACRALGAHKEAALPLLGEISNFMRQKNPQRTAAGASVLYQMQTDKRFGDAVPGLAIGLGSSNLAVQIQCAQSLGGIGPNAKDAVPYLRLVIRTKAPALVRAKALWALAQMKDEALPAEPEAKISLGDPVRDIRYNAVLVYAAFGPKAKDYIGDIKPLLNDEDPDLRVLVVEFLRTLGVSAKQTISIFDVVKSLKDSDARVRRSAAMSLSTADQGPQAKAAVPALILALKDNDPGVREAAAVALGSLGAEARATALPSLEATMDDRIKRVSFAAIGSYGELGGMVKERLAPVIEGIKDGTYSNRKAAIDALGRMGSKAIPAIGALTELQGQSDADLEPLIKLALERIKNANAPKKTP